MSTYSKISDLNSLYSNIFEASRYIMRQNSLLVPLVTNTSGTGMAPRIFSRNTETTAAAIGEGSAFTQSTLAKTAIGTATPITVQHGFLLTDEMVATDPEDAGRRAAREAGLAIALKQDQDISDLFDNFTVSKGTGGSALTLANIASGMSVLMQRSSAPGQINGVVGAYQWHDLLTQFSGINANPVNTYQSDLANEALRQYFVSQYLGARWFISPAIGTTGTAGTAFGGLFGQDALVYDERSSLVMETDRKVENRAELLSWTVRYAAAIQDDRYGVGLKARNSEPS